MGILAGHFHESPDIAARVAGQQVFASGGRAFVDEVRKRGVVAQEGNGLMHEMQHGDADFLFEVHEGGGLVALRWPSVSRTGLRQSITDCRRAIANN
ncbi:hypothetical protein D3C86_1846970 [compost metagenome]